LRGIRPDCHLRNFCTVVPRCAAQTGAMWPPKVLALTLLAALAPVPASAGCADSPVYGWLDFWLGDWVVCVGRERAGTNRVTRVLDGCAVVEDWTDADGSRGTSLFYVAWPEGAWRQVWVTDDARRPGGWKEKHLVARRTDGSLRFQGEIVLADAGRLLDRTTLAARADGRVTQRIEVSRDGGDTWTIAFDAVYRRPTAGLGCE
jgi:hypothetical protein